MTVTKNTPLLRKPSWIRTQLPQTQVINQLKRKLRHHHLHTVCEAASCPNLNECFSEGTASFMIMGDICRECRIVYITSIPIDEDCSR